jgi:hypothetical protein
MSLVAVLAAASALGLFARSRNGIVKAAPLHYDFSALGVQPGRVTLLQFSQRLLCPVPRHRRGAAHSGRRRRRRSRGDRRRLIASTWPAT